MSLSKGNGLARGGQRLSLSAALLHQIHSREALGPAAQLLYSNTRMSLRAVQGLQVAVSIYAEKGLLDKSTVVRIRLQRRPAPETARKDLPAPFLNQPVEFEEMLEFPSERELASSSRIRPRAHGLRSMLRVSTLAAFAAGVAVGASPGRLDLGMSTMLTVTAPRLPTPVPLTGALPSPAPPQVTLPMRALEAGDSNVFAGLFLRSFDELDQPAVGIDREHESSERALNRPRTDAGEAIAAGPGPID